MNTAKDMFTGSSEDASSSSVTTPPAAPPCGPGDNVSMGAAAAAAFSPLPSLDSTLSALLEEDDPPVPDNELLLPIEYQQFAAAGDEPQPDQQQFAQVPVVLPPVAGAADHPGLQTQMSSTASELLHVASSGYTADECFAAAMAVGGGYVGLDEALCQQPPQPGALLPAAGMMETAAAQGCYFGKDAAAAAAQAAGGGFFGTAAGGCGGMTMMSMMGMDEIGEYQRMMESASAALAATHSPDADAQQMAFGGNVAAGEMQVESASARTHGMLACMHRVAHP